jgi:isoaspartyl peptidase/L-asparaginase-like protein (Ntn-hydrolase superfamily)
MGFTNCAALWSAGRAIRCFAGQFDEEAVGAVALVDHSRLFAATSTSLFELDARSQKVVVRVL